MAAVVLLDAIATALSDASIAGGSTGWDLTKGSIHEEGDKAVTILEAGGGVPDQDGSGAAEHDFPEFQIRVRGAVFGYEAARAKMKQVFDTLNNATVSGFVFIYANSSPLPLGLDDNNRPEIVLNFSAMQER